MKLLPHKKHEYPLHIAIWWLTIWVVMSFLISYLTSTQSVNGYIEKRDCVVERQKQCTLYSRMYKIPLEQELATQIVGAGIIIGLIVMVGGYGRMILAKE